MTALDVIPVIRDHGASERAAVSRHRALQTGSLRARPRRDRGEAPHGKLDGGEGNEGGQGLGEVFEILGCRHRPVARS